MKNHQVRISGFELMRIISMIFIIINHIIDQNLVASTDGEVNIILIFIISIIRVHVCSFVILSGYFQSKKEFKFTKLISINNSIWFYNILFLIIMSSLGLVSLDIVSKLKIISPITYNDYWFASMYMVLYFISPILNRLIYNISKREFQLIILIQLIVFSILPSITGEQFFNNLNGFSIQNFILLYFIGAYLRNYPINRCFIFKNCNLNLFKLVCIILFFALAISNFSMYFLGKKLLLYGNVSKYIGGLLTNTVFNYDNPVIIIQSIFYFSFFYSLTIKSRIINFIGKYTFGIYLVHENPLIKKNIYTYLGFNKNVYSYSVIFNIFKSAIIIFVLSFMIEFVRKCIFKFIYNRKFSSKLRKWFQDYFNSLGFNIKW